MRGRAFRSLIFAALFVSTTAFASDDAAQARLSAPTAADQVPACLRAHGFPLRDHGDSHRPPGGAHLILFNDSCGVWARAAHNLKASDLERVPSATIGIAVFSVSRLPGHLPSNQFRPCPLACFRHSPRSPPA